MSIFFSIIISPLIVLNHFIKYKSGIIHQLRTRALLIILFAPLFRLSSDFQIKICKLQQFERHVILDKTSKRAYI